MTRPTPVLLAALTAMLLVPADDARPLHGLDALVWVQTSAEYRANVRQTWRTVQWSIDDALTGDAPCAVLADEKPGDGAALPPAIIVDVDETVLDNSPYQARLAIDGTSFSSKSWTAWVEEAAARPLPGALEALRHAASRGVRVFYVTNRDAEHEEATRRNLAKWGFPLAQTDTVLTCGEKDGWGSDKTSRRRFVAATHRVLLIAGDDLNDFIGARTMSLAERGAVFREYDARWGTSWFMLPNPSYGSWMDAALDGGGDDSTAARLAALDPRR